MNSDLNRRAGSTGVAWLAAVLALACATLLAAAPRDAAAATSFCPSGSGAGQCGKAEGIAVDRETGRVYVADRGNNRVNVFAADGTFVMAFGWGVADGVSNELQSCTAVCFKGIVGSGAGQFSQLRGIAVDNDPLSPSQHAIYTGTAASRVQKFEPDGSYVSSLGSAGSGPCQLVNTTELDPIAVGPGGTVYVADNDGEGSTVMVRLEKFSPTGACLGEIALGVVGGRARSLAVDSGGNVYVSFELAQVIRKYDPTGAALFSLTGEQGVSALAVDATDRLFVAAGEPPQFPKFGYGTVAVYSSSGSGLSRFKYGAIDEGNHNGIAPYESAGGDVFVGQQDFLEEGGVIGVEYLSLPDGDPIVPPAGTLVSPIRSTGATLKAEVNPEGKATSYHFDYVDQAGFEAGEFSGPTVKSTPIQTLAGAADFKLHAAEATIGCLDPVTEQAGGECLDPDTTYHFRAVASNADGGTEGTVAGAPFRTLKPFEILATWSAEVGADAARLQAEVNPFGIPTSGYFEYVDDAGYQASGFDTATRAPAQGTLDFGAAATAAIRGTAIAGLASGTVYHYRLVATDLLPSVGDVPSEAHTFTTFAPPVGTPCAANEAFRVGPSALLPDCRAYEMVSPLEKNNGDILAIGEATTELPATLDQSSTSGERLVYGSYRSFGDAEAGPLTSQYLAARGEEGWQTHGISPPRERLTLAAGNTLDTELKALSPDLCQAWFRSVAEPPLASGAVARYANLYRRDDGECSAAGWAALTKLTPPHRVPNEYTPLELQGLSADGRVSIYVANDNLPGTGAPELSGTVLQRRQLYQQTATGQTRFVCVLSSGAPSGTPCQAGAPGTGLSRTATLQGAISSDGQRIFWTSYPNTPGAGQIYLRINGSETLAVSKGGEDLSGVEKASTFWLAAADGSRAIFSVASSAKGISDLYEFNLQSKATRLIAHKSPGVLGASADARWLYFASEEALTPANAEGRTPVAGKANLYLEFEGSLRFVATLASADIGATDKTPLAISRVPMGRAARVAADGHHAAFVSLASPTGYDSTDAISGKTDAQAFLYDADANGGQGGLVCASCNPTGSRPVGRDLIKGTGERWAAGEIPVWENSLYAPRALASDGRRLYFTSSDALALRDTNGVADVYQWEAAGTGGCSQGDPSYVLASDGCVDLVSSGTSAQAIRFTDASPSGDDVFFSTLASLVPQDYGLVDIYDARVGGGFPSPPLTQAGCEGEACQGPYTPPDDPTPASSSFAGAGNVADSPLRRCAKGKVRRGNRCVAKKHRKGAMRAHRRAANHHRRAAR